MWNDEDGVAPFLFLSLSSSSSFLSLCLFVSLPLCLFASTSLLHSSLIVHLLSSRTSYSMYRKYVQYLHYSTVQYLFILPPDRHPGRFLISIRLQINMGSNTTTVHTYFSEETFVPRSSSCTYKDVHMHCFLSHSLPPNQRQHSHSPRWPLSRGEDDRRSSGSQWLPPVAQNHSAACDQGDAGAKLTSFY